MPFVVNPPPAQTVTLSDANPKSEGTASAPGSMGQASRADHVHERLVSAFDTVLDKDGYATVDFTRTFAKKPGIVYSSLDSVGGPVPEFSGTLIIKDGLYVGARVYGERKKPLPLLTGLSLVGNLVTALTGYKAWEPAAGAAVCVIAIESTKI